MKQLSESSFISLVSCEVA